MGLYKGDPSTETMFINRGATVFSELLRKIGGVCLEVFEIT